MDDKKAARLAKLQAWRAQQGGCAAAAAAPAPQPQPPQPQPQQQAEGLLNEEGDEVDPLDAFMAAEVLPEVAAREAEEARRAVEEKAKLQELLAKVGGCLGGRVACFAACQPLAGEAGVLAGASCSHRRAASRLPACLPASCLPCRAASCLRRCRT